MLRVVFSPQEEETGSRKYFWNCGGTYAAEGDGKGCGFFEWAEFDEDGEPVWGKESTMGRTMICSD